MQSDGVVSVDCMKPSVDEVEAMCEQMQALLPYLDNTQRPVVEQAAAMLRSLSVDAAQPASEPVICVCQIDDGMVREWVQKARAVAESKGYKFAAQPQAEHMELLEIIRTARAYIGILEANEVDEISKAFLAKLYAKMTEAIKPILP
jgi:hypothetical protein